jgi:hypothetical protein
MTDILKDGGPAFPQNDLSGYGMGPAKCNNGGMSLRDWFAGQVMQGLLEGVAWDVAAEHAKRCAGVAYIAADAMLEARE